MHAADALRRAHAQSTNTLRECNVACSLEFQAFGIREHEKWTGPGLVSVTRGLPFAASGQPQNQKPAGPHPRSTSRPRTGPGRLLVRATPVEYGLWRRLACARPTPFTHHNHKTVQSTEVQGINHSHHTAVRPAVSAQLGGIVQCSACFRAQNLGNAQPKARTKPAETQHPFTAAKGHVRDLGFRSAAGKRHAQWVAIMAKATPATIALRSSKKELMPLPLTPNQFQGQSGIFRLSAELSGITFRTILWGLSGVGCSTHVQLTISTQE
eukprot:3656643-Prymnesium_polylepis.1